MNKTSGSKMLNALLAASGPLTTEQLAAAASLSNKDAFSRLWWLQKKDGILKSHGHGKTRRWQLTAAALRANKSDV